MYWTTRTRTITPNRRRPNRRKRRDHQRKQRWQIRHPLPPTKNQRKRRGRKGRDVGHPRSRVLLTEEQDKWCHDHEDQLECEEEKERQRNQPYQDNDYGYDNYDYRPFLWDYDMVW